MKMAAIFADGIYTYIFLHGNCFFIQISLKFVQQGFS